MMGELNSGCFNNMAAYQDIKTKLIGMLTLKRGAGFKIPHLYTNNCMEIKNDQRWMIISLPQR